MSGGHESESPDQSPNEVIYSKRSCCCFWMPCLRSDPSPPSGSLWWERIRGVENEDHWWIKSWKKLREWSEILAGPKWKTFIRQFNKNNRNNFNNAGLGGGGGPKQNTFRYDPLSYSLNFDDGQQDLHDDHYLNDDYVRRDFSTRFASIPASAKSSMDLGKDGPSFT